MAKGKPTKEERKAAKTASRAASKERRAQIWQAFQMQRKEDKALVPLLIAVVVVTTAVLVGLSFVIGIAWWAAIPLGIILGVLLAFIVFGRRVQKNVYRKADGQPGAAAWALENLKGSWRVTSAVAATTQLDAVHRVIGKPGVILVGEGAQHRVKPLLAQEKKRSARIIGDTPIYEIMMGNEEGQIPLAKLQRHITKLPKNIDTKTLDTIEARMNALHKKGGSGGAAKPKGPLPGGAKQRGIQRTVRRR
ncbi:MAG: DUF4191 domain-containing protein [Tomitella sp.]|nr:DUF4191 domain-containing protein [Tomitella sp.]